MPESTETPAPVMIVAFPPDRNVATLSTASSRVSFADAVDDGEEVRRLREQIRVMGEQMDVLARVQQESAWAQGLSDELPPGYTPQENTER